jgi:hypothetical protein
LAVITRWLPNSALDAASVPVSAVLIQIDHGAKNGTASRY